MNLTDPAPVVLNLTCNNNKDQHFGLEERWADLGRNTGIAGSFHREEDVELEDPTSVGSVCGPAGRIERYQSLGQDVILERRTYPVMTAFRRGVLLSSDRTKMELEMEEGRDSALEMVAISWAIRTMVLPWQLLLASNSLRKV